MFSPNSRLIEHLVNELKTPDELHVWVQLFCGIDVPREKVCADHDAPFDYLVRAYFEPAKDQIVWAPRGGGKTRLAAIATLLDLLHKSPCSVRILGGSLDQSLRMWEHLLPNIESVAPHLIKGKIARNKRLDLTNESSAAVLTQSERAVRGLRVQKLRCDEVELFDPAIWEAAQLVTKSTEKAHGAIDALSTMHTPFGLMSQIVERAKGEGTAIVKWCLLEVLERCPPKRDCATCPLWDDCKGVAKNKSSGFLKIDDAIRMKKRVSRETWESEMLCRRPNTRMSVFPSFAEDLHVISTDVHVPSTDAGAAELQLTIDFGFSNPFVCLWIHDTGGRVVVVDEYVQSQRTIHEHLDHIERKSWGRAKTISCDPAGAGRSDQTAKSNIGILKSRGYVVRSMKSAIVDGIEMIRTALRPASGEPTLFVHSRCTHLIRALKSYRYPDHGGELPVKDGTHDHPIDALRYFFVNRNKSRALRSRSY